SAAEVFWMMFSRALLTSTITFARTAPDDASAVSQIAAKSGIFQYRNRRLPQHAIRWRAIANDRGRRSLFQLAPSMPVLARKSGRLGVLTAGKVRRSTIETGKACHPCSP